MPDCSNILFASDYDRTITDFSGQIPACNLEAVEAFEAMGGCFTIATGRSKPMFAQKLPLLPLHAPVILFNGAAVWMPDGEVIVRYPMPRGWKDAVRDIHSRFPQLRVELQNLNWHDCFGRDDLRDAYLERNGVEYRYPALENVGDEVLGISFYTPFQEIGHSRSFDVPPEEDRPFQEIEAILAKDFPGMFESVRSMPRMIELGAAGCGKGATARWLAGQLGRTVLYCAGDAPNDLPMLLEADEAFIPVSSDPAILGYGFTEVASCDEGTIASAVALIRSRGSDH